ncbi:MAG: hypothetical protein KI790_19395 [Cyclobacteriaceae bacterium]|nr:hypothetical protein [Cyclobacteriaceae bacterium HetDA_MAG_MS6]
MRKYPFILVVELIMLFIILSTYSSQAQSFLPTKLKVTVIDGLGNFVEKAEVKLFLSKEDYMNSVNPVFEGKTNAKGQVVFKKVEPISYFIDARKNKLNNDGEGVQIQELQEGRINKINTVIE